MHSIDIRDLRIWDNHNLETLQELNILPSFVVVKELLGKNMCEFIQRHSDIGIWAMCLFIKAVIECYHINKDFVEYDVVNVLDISRSYDTGRAVGGITFINVGLEAGPCFSISFGHMIWYIDRAGIMYRDNKLTGKMEGYKGHSKEFYDNIQGLSLLHMDYLSFNKNNCE